MIKPSTKIILAYITFILLVGCSSKSPVDKKQHAVETAPIEQTQSTNITTNSVIQQAKALPLMESIPLLVQASELFLQEHNPKQALWLANEITPLLNTVNTTNANNKQDVPLSYRLALVKTQSLYQLNYFDLAFEQLENATVLSTNFSLKNTAQYYQLQATLLKEKQRPIIALDAEMRAFALNNNATQADIEWLWQQISALSPWQLTQLVNYKAPFIKGWQKLSQYSHQFGHNPTQLTRYIRQWQRHFPTHPAMFIANELQQVTFEYKTLNNIAIILPLSGNQKAAGNAAQQGILSAYKNNSTKTLHFIDSNTVDWTTLHSTFEELAIDYVIGPLLRNNVESYLAQADLSQPLLLLNLPNKQTLKPNQVALSMRPEDEALQAANTLSQQQYQHPIVISHKDKVSKRIALSFASQWQLMTDNNIEVVYFENGKQMQANLKTSLDVDTSQARIKELQGRLKQTLKTESRNRRDIDMIYIVGSAQQTRLIKPYIDVNISPFAKVIPVFASSRSHSTNTETNRDLNGLTFTEMPWLIKSKQQNKTLATLSNEIWPKRSDSLKRIFAMGFDSIQLIDKIPLMLQAHYIQHQGQVGTLKLDKNNVLSKSLIWARYQNDKVNAIVLN